MPDTLYTILDNAKEKLVKGSSFSLSSISMFSISSFTANIP